MSIDDPHYVYEMLAADGTHLYVGCTGNMASRLSQHHSEKAWWGDIARIEIDTYPDRETALAAERERIELYVPTHNVIFTERYDRGGWKARRARMAAAHDAGQICSDASCHPCIDADHALGRTCRRHFSGCTVCRGYRPRWNDIDEEDEAAS